MTDWRQVRARIRRAKAGPDATARLEQLFDKTRDGMVAFELAQLEENSGRMERAIDWYKRAWQRFRRAEWKQKAEEALVRHGIPLPVAADDAAPDVAAPSAEAESSVETPAEPLLEVVSDGDRENEQPATQPAETEPAGDSVPVLAADANQPESPAPDAKPAIAVEGAGRPHRRRRGGRRRGRGGKRGANGAEKAEAAPESQAPAHVPPRRAKAPEPRPSAERRTSRTRLPAVQIYRRGEPALASEIKALEAKLRQLLASPPHSLADLGELPANPGVYLVSDLDLTTMYYLEACGNMRSAMDQLVSGRRGRQGSVRSRLAKYLGIGDSQASRYLKQHCVARWIDSEESDAGALGHFARAVLRPELMEQSD